MVAGSADDDDPKSQPRGGVGKYRMLPKKQKHTMATTNLKKKGMPRKCPNIVVLPHFERLKQQSETNIIVMEALVEDAVKRIPVVVMFYFKGNLPMARIVLNMTISTFEPSSTKHRDDGYFFMSWLIGEGEAAAEEIFSCARYRVFTVRLRRRVLSDAGCHDRVCVPSNIPINNNNKNIAGASCRGCGSNPAWARKAAASS